MSQIYSCNGITIYVYPDDHEPPHVHIFCFDTHLKIDLYTGDLISGTYPNGKKKAVTKAFKDCQAAGLLKWKEYNGDAD